MLESTRTMLSSPRHIKIRIEGAEETTTVKPKGEAIKVPMQLTLAQVREEDEVMIKTLDFVITITRQDMSGTRVSS